jgi:hypothetical protein
MANQLITALSDVSEALQPYFSALSQSAPQNPPTLRHNVKWSKLCINAIPTGKTNFQEACTPDQVHNALATENPFYVALIITQKPSWAQDPSFYTPGTISSLSVSFEDPDSTSAQNLLHHRTLFAFGHVVTIKRWRQTSPKRVPSKKTAPHTKPPPAQGLNPPADSGSQPTLYHLPNTSAVSAASTSSSINYDGAAHDPRILEALRGP